MPKPYNYPDALPHGELRELLPDLFFVTGSVRMSMGLDLVFSRNMMVIRQGEELILVNTVRLSEQGLSELEKLGKVTHIMRIAGFHGMDDPFYRERYNATLWSIDAPYSRGFHYPPKPHHIYCEPDKLLTPDGELPIADASLFLFKSAYPLEGIIRLERDDGVLITGDSLQNWSEPDDYFNWFAKFIMKLMGFFKPYGLGPGWIKQAKPDNTDIKAVLSMEFDKLLPSHGDPVMSDAKEKYAQTIGRY